MAGCGAVPSQGTPSTLSQLHLTTWPAFGVWKLERSRENMVATRKLSFAWPSTTVCWASLYLWDCRQLLGSGDSLCSASGWMYLYVTWLEQNLWASLCPRGLLDLSRPLRPFSASLDCSSLLVLLIRSPPSQVTHHWAGRACIPFRETEPMGLELLGAPKAGPYLHITASPSLPPSDPKAQKTLPQPSARVY